MFTFTLKREGRKHHMALVSLYPATPHIHTDNTHYYVSCGAYALNKEHSRTEYQGVSVHGEIPIAEFVRWAIRKGFLTWEEVRHTRSGED